MKRVCVFCGSSPGGTPAYAQAATELGRTLVRREIGLVYGGASIGMMGILASTVLEGGGEVIGVIPEALVDKEVALTELPDLRVVKNMHDRKALMAELSDAVIGLPGGLGTIEEFFEFLTWGQLGIHEKPCGLLNVCGYYDRLLDFLDYATDELFIDIEHRAMVLTDKDSETLLDRFQVYEPPRIDKAARMLQKSARTGS